MACFWAYCSEFDWISPYGRIPLVTAGMAGATSGTIGSVNGEKLDFADFQKQVSENEDRYKSQGYPVNDMLTQNIREEVWKQFEDNAVLPAEYQKLGIDVSDKELNDMLVGPNAVQEIKRAFTDPNTGVFDSQQAAEKSIS